ncbi:hypothetical protein EBZ39_11275 [bacterium]|nr:hypothetical protein [bacterium]
MNKNILILAAAALAITNSAEAFRETKVVPLALGRSAFVCPQDGTAEIIDQHGKKVNAVPLRQLQREEEKAQQEHEQKMREDVWYAVSVKQAEFRQTAAAEAKQKAQIKEQNRAPQMPESPLSTTSTAQPSTNADEVSKKTTTQVVGASTASSWKKKATYGTLAAAAVIGAAAYLRPEERKQVFASIGSVVSTLRSSVAGLWSSLSDSLKFPTLQVSMTRVPASALSAERPNPFVRSV